MYPVLFRLGSWQVTGYWAMAALGFLAAYLYLRLENRRLGECALPWYHANNLMCLSMLSIVVGGVLMNLCVKLPELARNWEFYRENMGRFWQSALTIRGFYGGILVLALSFTIYVRHFRLPGDTVVALFVPICALFMGFGRLGCFLGGCCYGIPVSWGIVFPEGGMAPAGVPLFPTQLAEAAGNFLIFCLLCWAKPRLTRKKELVLIYAGSYAVLRFFLEFVRADPGRGSLGPFTTSQWIGLGILAAIGVYAICHRRKRSI